MKVLKSALLIIVAFIVLAAITVYSGVFNFAADEPHWGLTTRLIETARERFIVRQADGVKVPENLLDAKLVTSGAGEYAEMCTECHLAPGMKDTEMRVGLYPRPPNLAEDGAHSAPAEQFWIIKHGLKLSGMPAWGLTHDDERIWSMVAFLQKLPELTPEAYRELIESGGGGHHHDDIESDGSRAESSRDEKAHAHSHTESHTEAHPEEEAAKVRLPPGALSAAEAVDSFHERLAQGDTTGAAQLLDSSVLIYEGGEAEKSRAEYASHHLGIDAEFLKNTEVRRLSRTGNAVGNFAWIATESELKSAGAKAFDLITTETMVLQRGVEGWRVTHIHWSSKPKK